MLNAVRKCNRWRVIEFFLLHPNTEITLAKLYRKVGISKPVVLKILKELQKEGFLKTRKEGRSIFYSFNRTPINLELKRFFGRAFVLASGVTNITKNKVILFGSFSNGTYTENSDIDIAIIKVREDIDYKKLTKIGKKLEFNLDVIELDFKRIPEYRKKNKEIWNNIQKGFVLRDYDD